MAQHDFKLVRLYWRGMPLRAGGAVPGGVTAADLAAEAILDTIAGTRVWDSEAQPDFYRFLRSVVDSKVSHLAECLENQLTRRLPVSADGDDPPQEYEVPDKAPDPATVCANKEALEKFRAAVLAGIQGDKMAEGVFRCLEAEITGSQDMALLLEVSEQDINNAKKRLRRGVERVMKAQRKGG
jgi:hypothetical protein